MSGGILILSSCTSTKVERSDGGARWAESLYGGQQHIRLMRGVKEYRDAAQPVGRLQFHILSAYYGLLSARRSITSYDHSFSGLSTEAIRRQSLDKKVPEDIRKVLCKPFDLGILMLGDPYLRACDLDTGVKLAGPTIAFCSPKMARWLPDIDGLRTVELSNREARRFSCGLAALKGEFGGRILSALSEVPEDLDSLLDPNFDLLKWLETVPSTSPADLQLLATG